MKFKMYNSKVNLNLPLNSKASEQDLKSIY